MPEELTPYQRAALDAYADGDFAYIDSYPYKHGDQFLVDVGDGLLTFIMIELSSNEDCENLAVAIQRIESGIRDLQTVLEALQKLEES